MDLQGAPGSKGDLGAQGPAGVQGLQGVQGPAGVQGLKGDAGTSQLVAETLDLEFINMTGFSTVHAVDLQKGDIVLGEAWGWDIVVKDLQRTLPKPYPQGYSFPLDGVVVCKMGAEFSGKSLDSSGQWVGWVDIEDGMNYTFFFVAPSTGTYVFIAVADSDNKGYVKNAIVIRQVPA